MSDESRATAMNKTSRGWLRRNIPKAVIILAAIGALTAITKLPVRKQDVAAGEAPPVNVTVLTVTAEPELADTFALPAVVEPNRIVTVSAEVAGQIERMPLRKGNAVHAGDLLIELNTDLLRPQFEAAEAQAKHDKTEYDRVAGLVKSGASPPRDLDNATTQLAISRANLEQLRATLDRTRIFAPTDGILNDLPVEEGEYVQPDARVAEIVETDVVKVVVQVPERDIRFFAVGQEAEVFVDTKGLEQEQEQSLVGTITFISELAHPATRSTRLELSLANEQHLLRSGQIVRVRLKRRMLKDAILVPLLAVIPMEDSKAVYVVNSATAQRREVRLGIIKDDRVQIRSGLEPGDRLIVAGHRFVAPGQKVNVVSENK